MSVHVQGLVSENNYCESKDKDILDKAYELQEKLSQYRQHLHSFPELSFQEYETANYISKTLKELGYSVKENFGGKELTGLVAEIGQGEKTVVLRADMDALPISEVSTQEYCSKNKGVMHACGHDAHMSCLLGAAHLLAQNPPKNGKVRLLFQPAEEATNNEGKSGAGLMIEAGAIDGAEAIFGLHVFPNIPVGKIALKSGPLLAACDTFTIKIKGKAAHGAWPHLGVDSIVLASHVVQAVQAIISRRVSALEPAVITIGGIKSTTYRPNIVAEEVELVGTVRCFSKQLQEQIQTELRNACRIAEVLGGSIEFNWVAENPALMNDASLTNLVKETTNELLGSNSAIEASLELGAEDFSFLAAQVPACFFFLGVQLENHPCGLHTPHFDIDEKALPIGAAVLVQSALNYLANINN